MSARLIIQHERWMDDRWTLMLVVNGVKFSIGAACQSLKEAQQVRTDFRVAMAHLNVTLPIEE